jgi:phage gp36-like protein
MAFISQSDYKSQIRDARLNQMIDNDPTVLTLVESEAVATVKNKLFQWYDVTTIFSETGEDRDALVLLWCKRVALYILHGRLPNAMIPKHIEDDYKETTDWLAEISKGNVAVDLPYKTEDSNGDGTADRSKAVFRYGGAKSRSQ